MFDTAWTGWSTLTILAAGFFAGVGGGPLLWIRASGQGQLMIFVSGLGSVRKRAGDQISGKLDDMINNSLRVHQRASCM